MERLGWNEHDQNDLKWESGQRHTESHIAAEAMVP